MTGVQTCALPISMFGSDWSSIVSCPLDHLLPNVLYGILVRRHKHISPQAMACGRPVLATRSGGMPEYLAGSQAVLVERGDTVTDQLAWSIRMLYEHPALCTEMGAAGAARGREFSTAHYYEEFVRIVRDVTENGGAQ